MAEKSAVGRRLLAVGLWLAVAAGCGGPGVGPLGGVTMGTTFSVLYVAPPEVIRERGPELQAAVEARLAEINRRMSTYDPESELSRFNRHAGDGWFPVSAETARVVASALELAEDTGGAFDPTVGPAVNLWGFGPDGGRRQPPTEEQVAAALRRVGWRKVEARLDPPALRKKEPAAYLDLSAIAKGYASDALVDLLTELGVEACMVEIGGEVSTRGAKPDGSPWQIGVEAPIAEARSLQLVVELAGDSLATSGDYRNYFEAGGVRYSHTIDPATGRPVTHDLATVTVRAPRCQRADAVATALLVLGPTRGYDWAQEHGVAALLTRRTPDGPVELSTTAWRAGAAPGGEAADPAPATQRPATRQPTTPKATTPAPTTPKPETAAAG